MLNFMSMVYFTCWETNFNIDTLMVFLKEILKGGFEYHG